MAGDAGRSPGDPGCRIVAIGGGTGLPVVLTALKRYLGTRVSELTGVVTVADDGGSSGRLRQELAMLPPGDIRNCLVALADVEPLMAELFQFRFGGEGALAGHSFGNLFLAALTGVTGNFLQAIRISSRVLAVRGTILPSTLEAVTLGAELGDGSLVRGESQLPDARRSIRRVFLEPPTVRALPEVLEALDRADVIVLAPGSLYTSLIPNLLVGGLAEALRHAAGLRIYVANLMTEPGETDGMTLADHVEALHRHAGRSILDAVLVHGRALPPHVVERYADTGAYPVQVDQERLAALGVWLAAADLAGRSTLARHHPDKLGRAVLRLLRDGGFSRRRGGVPATRREHVVAAGRGSPGPASEGDAAARGGG